MRDPPLQPQIRACPFENKTLDDSISTGILLGGTFLTSPSNIKVTKPYPHFRILLNSSS